MHALIIEIDQGLGTRLGLHCWDETTGPRLTERLAVMESGSKVPFEELPHQFGPSVSPNVGL